MKLQNKNILIIAFEFPPTNSGGSHRPYKFALELLANGFHPIVISADIPNSNLDTSIQIPEGITNIRLPLKKALWFHKFYNSYYFNIMDNSFNLWGKNLKLEIQKIFIEYKPSSTYVTIPPFSIGQIIPHIKSKYNTNIILDMRDAWSQWNHTPFASYLHYRACLFYENKFLLQSDHIVVPTEQVKIDLLRNHTNINSSKITTITNFYTELNIKEIPSEISLKIKNKIKIGYIGSFYFNPISHKLIYEKWWLKKPYQYFQYVPRQENWLYRSPYFFFKTISKLILENPEYKNKIEIHLGGTKPPWLDEMISSLKLNENIIHHGFLNKIEIHSFYLEMDAFLSTSSKIEEFPDYCIAGKTFEYISYCKPILAFVCKSALKTLLDESKLSINFDPDNTDGNVIKMLNIIQNETLIYPNKDLINQCSSKFQTKKLLSILDLNK